MYHKTEATDSTDRTIRRTPYKTPSLASPTHVSFKGFNTVSVYILLPSDSVLGALPCSSPEALLCPVPLTSIPSLSSVMPDPSNLASLPILVHSARISFFRCIQCLNRWARRWRPWRSHGDSSKERGRPGVGSGTTFVDGNSHPASDFLWAGRVLTARRKSSDWTVSTEDGFVREARGDVQVLALGRRGHQGR